MPKTTADQQLQELRTHYNIVTGANSDMLWDVLEMHKYKNLEIIGAEFTFTYPDNSVLEFEHSELYGWDAKVSEDGKP